MSKEEQRDLALKQTPGAFKELGENIKEQSDGTNTFNNTQEFDPATNPLTEYNARHSIA